MLPLLREGVDSVMLSLAEEIKKYDMVLYQRDDGQFVLHRVVGIEDSGAGACSVRLAGYTTIGIAGGNIVESGTKAVCNYYEDSFEDILKIIKG